MRGIAHIASRTPTYIGCGSQRYRRPVLRRGAGGGKPRYHRRICSMPSRSKTPKESAPKSRMSQPAAKAAHRISLNGEAAFQISIGIGSQNRMSANSARLAACTKVQRSKAGGKRPATCVLNHGRAITECCKPKSPISARSMRAARAG